MEEETLCHTSRCNLAVTSLKLGDYTDTLDWAEEVIEIGRNAHKFLLSIDEYFADSRWYFAFWAKGAALESLGRIEDAIESFEAAATCKPECEDTGGRLAALVRREVLEPLDNTMNMWELLDNWWLRKKPY